MGEAVRITAKKPEAKVENSISRVPKTVSPQSKSTK